MCRQLAILACVMVSCVTAGVYGGPVPAAPQNAGIRLPHGLTITSIKPSAQARLSAPEMGIAAETPSLPQPPISGFLPLIAVVTSDRHSSDDFDWEHVLESSYVGKPLNAPAEKNYVIGVLDTGDVSDLVAGASAQLLGLKGSYLTTNSIPIAGVSGTIDAQITTPIGIFAAGLGAIKPDGQLDLSQLVGHTNVCALVSPPIECENGEKVRASIGTPLLAFHTTIIQVDQPRRVVVHGETFIGPDIQITDSYTPPTSVYRHKIPIELGGMAPVATASYYAFPDLGGDWEDILGEWLPITPTVLSMAAGDLPTGAMFFVDVGLLQGQAGPLNMLQNARMMLDTGAQGSIISTNIAAKLNLPLEPDFTTAVCGAGGLTEVPGYYIDYVRINAMGGAMEFARVPFVVIDMDSPEGGTLDGVLGMNFFWNRNVVLESTTTGTGFLYLSEPVPYAFVDLNADDVVDGQDFAIFAAAWRTTEGDPAWNPRCDFFTDGVIDARDLDAFVDAWTRALAK